MNGKFSYFVDAFDVICVEVQDWDVVCFAEFGRVLCRSLVHGSSSVSDLVVDHEMDTPSSLLLFNVPRIWALSPVGDFHRLLLVRSRLSPRATERSVPTSCSNSRPAWPWFSPWLRGLRPPND